ncbi:required for respiratory growth protein 9, mitochondrial [Phaeosphaeriaceae sp. PMI808]|nr:required for respiratory growth protein 9, mitochondrial [Phaeosphaeriaceae sp. PMI808]
MTCHNCARTTLNLFIRSFSHVNQGFVPLHGVSKATQPSRFISSTRRRLRLEETNPQSPSPIIEDVTEGNEPTKIYERPAWQIQKAALKEKLGGESWNPRKKLSPDTMDGIRHLHSTQPDKFTTPILAEHFKVAPEAIRRILKSKWRPSDEEYESRLQRWEKRGERIWTNLVEMGVKPPKMWREMGVGRAENGARPKWKSNQRNMVDVRDSTSTEVFIPIVDGKEKKKPKNKAPLFERL